MEAHSRTAYGLVRNGGIGILCPDPPDNGVVLEWRDRGGCDCDGRTFGGGAVPCSRKGGGQMTLKEALRFWLIGALCALPVMAYAMIFYLIGK